MADEGQSGALQIARLTKGDKTRTARHAEVMNEIIDAVNALRSTKITVSDDGDQSPTGIFRHSDSNSHLELKLRKGAGAIAVTDDAVAVEKVTQINFVGTGFVFDGGPTDDGLGEQVDIKGPPSGTYMWGSVDGTLTWIPTTICDCSPTLNGGTP